MKESRITSARAVIKPQFNQNDVEIIARENLYKGFFRAEKIHLRHRLFATGQWCEPLSREVLYRGDAVGVLLYDPARDQIALVEQIRIGAIDEPDGPWCLEVVAGMVEAGETPREVARRELVEEAGVSDVRLTYIGHYLSSPGGSDEKLHLYCGQCDLTKVGGIYGLPEEGEDIKVHVLAAEQVFAALYTGRWNNPAALISLQWLQLHKAQLQNLPLEE